MVLATEKEFLNKLKEVNLNKDTLVLKALTLAIDIHKDQIRDSGRSYLEEHIYPVTIQLINRQKTHPDLKTLVIVSLLHDSVEDGELEDGYLTREFNQEIEKYIMGVTKRKVVLTEKPTQEWLYNQMAESIKKVEEAGEVSQIVKMEDRIQNTETMYVDSNKKDKYLRMIKEIHELFIPLAKRMNPKYNYVNILTEEANRVGKELN